MKYFAELKSKVRSDIFHGRYDPPKNAIARIKYDVLIKEVIAEFYNEYLDNPAKVYLFVRKLPMQLGDEIQRTAGYRRFLKRIHINDFSLIYREVYRVYGVNTCQCEECLKVLADRPLKPMYPTYQHYPSFDENEYLSRKAKLEKMSKAERVLDSFTLPEVDVSDLERESDMRFITNLKLSEPININDLKCPHAKAMIFIKAKTKKGN